MQIIYRLARNLVSTYLRRREERRVAEDAETGCPPRRDTGRRNAPCSPSRSQHDGRDCSNCTNVTNREGRHLDSVSEYKISFSFIFTCKSVHCLKLLTRGHLRISKDILKVKIQSPESICKTFLWRDSLLAPLQQSFIYFSTRSPWIVMHLVSLGKFFFIPAS